MTMLHELLDAEYNVDGRRAFESKSEKLVSRSRRAENRSRKGPTSVNGMHRRRSKRFGW